MAAELQEKEQRPIDSRPLPDGKKFHVFISYSESDRSWVETVIQHLQNDYNFKCFEHSTDFIPGRKIRENIEYAILNSVKTLCVITEDYNQSFWCQFEVEFAILKLLAEMKENVIIPVLKEECEIPGYLKPFTYINGTGDMNVWLPKLASAIELEGEQYNHELALNRVNNAVNRNRNLDLLHEETSHINCRGPVFRWKYVPESLSIAPMKVNSEQYNEVIKTISSKHLVIGRHCRNLWWPTICFAVTIVIPTLFIGLLFTVVTVDSHYYTPSGILFAFPALAVLWLAMCGCSDYWGRREMKITLREVNRRLLPNKVMVTYKRQRTTATFTICFVFFDMTSCVNHMASELHNKRIRESQTREMVALDMNDDDDEALVDDIPGDSEAYNEQEMATYKLLDLSSAYLMDYMNEKLDNDVDNTRHATKAKCICQFAESLEIKTNTDV
ncbi:uncharacterized protein [Mytilus edulis]